MPLRRSADRVATCAAAVSWKDTKSEGEQDRSCAFQLHLSFCPSESIYILGQSWPGRAVCTGGARGEGGVDPECNRNGSPIRNVPGRLVAPSTNTWEEAAKPSISTSSCISTLADAASPPIEVLPPRFGASESWMHQSVLKFGKVISAAYQSLIVHDCEEVNYMTMENPQDAQFRHSYEDKTQLFRLHPIIPWWPEFAPARQRR